MDVPKKATRAVLGVGGAVGIGTITLLIGWRVDPVEARVELLEKSAEVKYAELIRRMERMEDKQDRLLESIQKFQPARRPSNQGRER